jgi:hypothetical protein
MKPKTEMELPKRAKLRTLSEDPKERKSMMAMEEPSRVIP